MISLDALLTLAIYLVPFLVLAIAAKLWMDRKGISLSDVQAEANPRRGDGDRRAKTGRRSPCF